MVPSKVWLAIGMMTVASIIIVGEFGFWPWVALFFWTWGNNINLSVANKSGLSRVVESLKRG